MIEQLSLFAMLAFFLVISPGPNLALILHSATLYDKKNTVTIILGLCSATFIHGALSILGISAILVELPSVYNLFLLGGGVYLAYNAIKGFISAYKLFLLIKTPGSSDKNRVNIDIKKEKFFTKGFITQLLNPKVSLFYLAVLPQFFAKSISVYFNFIYVFIHVGIIFTWFVTLTYGLHTLKETVNNIYFKCITQIVMSVILLFFSFWIIIQALSLSPTSLS